MINVMFSILYGTERKACLQLFKTTVSFSQDHFAHCYFMLDLLSEGRGSHLSSAAAENALNFCKPQFLPVFEVMAAIVHTIVIGLERGRACEGT